ncbi:MAG: hypothetical protein ABJB11_00205 [Ferruginibacter sp.]
MAIRTNFLKNGITCFITATTFFITPIVYGQVLGCTDPLSNNYNALATVNDGSCTYNTANYSPPVKLDPLSDSVIETSGLQFVNNFLWTFNDSGGQPELYKTDTNSNTLLQRVYLGGAVNIDWEDIAFDGTYFYVGDFGNNANGARADLKIYRFPYSAIHDAATHPIDTIPAGMIQKINFSYSDQPLPLQAVAANFTKFDCEAMIVDGGKIHLFTKNWVNFVTTHYVINGVTAGTYTALPVETLATNFLVTAADKAPGKKLVALLGYQNSGTANHFLYLLSDYNSGLYFNGSKRNVNLQDVFYMGQAEGITFSSSNYGYITNEKFIKYIGSNPIITVTSKLHSFATDQLISALASTYQFIGNGNWDIAGNWINNLLPPAVLPFNSEIFIDPLAAGQCILNVPYSLSTGCSIIVNKNVSMIIEGGLTVQ